MNLSNKYEDIKKELMANPAFHVIMANEQSLTATRLSNTPKRGVFRLLIPQALVVITNSKEQNPIIFVRPDSTAIFMVTVLLGGVGVEFFMDRSIYPREYPPEFIYGFAVFYIVLLIIEIFNTQKKVRKLLNQTK
jgi:hypothetical protein